MYGLECDEEHATCDEGKKERQRRRERERWEEEVRDGSGAGITADGGRDCEFWRCESKGI